MGLSVGAVQSDMSPAAARAAYCCDVTYVTGQQLCFNYLNDHTARSPGELVSRSVGSAGQRGGRPGGRTGEQGGRAGGRSRGRAGGRTVELVGS